MRKNLLAYALVIGWAGFLFSGQLFGGKKKKEDFTQTLALPKEPPMVATGETAKLTFQVSPLSSKGLLSAQTKEAIKAILKMTGGAPIIHVRAFVAGSGDLRRVPQIVSEVLTEKKMDLPSVSVVQGGALNMINAQVVIEAVSVARKEVNPAGLKFVAGKVMTAPDPLGKTDSLLQQSLASLGTELQGGEPLRVTCFLSNLNGNPATAITQKFPSAQVDVVQTQRSPSQALASCEGVSRGGPVTAERLAFTGTQIAFGSQDKDAALAFQRFDQQLSQAGSNVSDFISLNLYPLTTGMIATAHKVRPMLETSASVTFEGLASMDASFAVDAIAIAH